MTRTYILVDFENVQPSAADIRRVQGESLRLWIFRGPGQKKYSAEVAEAWQPLGDRVHFVACAKAGRNAVDMHVALEIGRLIGEAATGKGTRFVVVSKDTDFEPLLMHVRNLGYAATRATTLKAALEVGGAEKAEARAAKAKPPAKKASKQVAKKAAVKKTTVKKAAAKAPASKPPASPLPAARGAIDARAKVIESLHRMGEKRPAKRKGLERHIESHLGRKLAPGAVAEIVAELEREGVLKFSDKRVEYALPKARK